MGWIEAGQILKLVIVVFYLESRAGEQHMSGLSHVGSVDVVVVGNIAMVMVF